MHASFSSAAKAARAQMAVPAIDMEAIRNRAGSSAFQARIRHIAMSGAMALGLVGAAAALAANIGGVRIWILGNRADVQVESFAQVRNPTAADVASIVDRASFRAVIPARIPSGMRVKWIAYSPAERPNLIQILYGRADGSITFSVALVDTSTIQTDRATLSGGVMESKLGYHWRVGNETVLLSTANVSPALAAAMRASTQNESVAAGLDSIDANLWKVIVLGVPPKIADVAEKRAPAGRNVLFGKQGIGLIGGLAAHNQPMRDYRTVYLVNVPHVNGKPDYAHAKLQWPKIIAIPPDGVRAAARALKRAGVGPNCACAILVNQRAGAYAIWKIDEKTLKASPL